MKRNPLVIFIVGPTGVGKSAIALALAKKVKGEIISADSMQVYKGMDIGTAKPSLPEQRKIPHHLIDLIPASKRFSVFQYREKAIAKIGEISGRKRIPIVVGGSGLYVRSVLEGLSNLPGTHAVIRRRLLSQVKKSGLQGLYQALLARDQEYGRKIKPGDTTRIVRALEIIESSGKTPSQWHRGKKSLTDLGYFPAVIGIIRERSDLYRDIDKRVERMFRRGWVQEVSRLMEGKVSTTAAQALGYKEIYQKLMILDKKRNLTRTDLEELKLRIQQNTRRFAKRQITWFKKEKGIQWVTWAAGDSVASMCDKILNAIASLESYSHNDGA